MEIGDWLRGLGLERYADAFRGSDIKLDVMPELTDADLRELGVSLGDRKRLLNAARVLNDQEHGRVPAGAVPEAAVNAPSTMSPIGAERRQLTVMFVDLVGSTALSARLDPEEMRELLRAYQDAVTAEVARFDGHVAKYMGDGVLAYFGWPTAHEDDAERALGAGLAAVAATGRLAVPTGEPLACRVGIATGLVVVGDLLGEGAAREEAVTGETPNLAARLQALAEPGAVLIAERTRRLVGRMFELADLGVHAVKGFSEPVRAWRALGEGTAEGRFDAHQAGTATPLVGREHELALLLDRWARAREGEGQVVLLSGEPGIGKSRLIRALRERLRAESRTRLQYQCSPHHANSVLWPIIGQLERAAEMARDDPPRVRLEKLEALLAQAEVDVAAASPLLAELLAIPADGRYSPPELSPEQRKGRTFGVLLAQLAGLAAQRPVLMVLEDAHWIDPTSLELFDLATQELRRLPVLLLVTFRPEFRPPWADHPHATQLTLTRLGGHEARAIAEGVAAGEALSAAVLEQIVARTDGVPLFVEELTRTVLEAGVADDEAGAALAIPSTLHASLLARLDRLAPAKEVAQVGAVIGREFSHELLAAAAPITEAGLAAALDALVAAQLLFRRGAPPAAIYSFKHALVQDVAYATLLRSRRRQLHARVADTLERRFPATAAAQPELVAHHLAEAGLGERAMEYWRKAGERAAERSALREAAAHLGRGLELASGLPASPERARQELGMLLALGPVLMGAKGWAAPEVERAYLRARQLAQELADDGRLFTATWNLWHHHQLGRCAFGEARRYAEEALVLARRSSDQALLLQAHHSAWTTCLYLPDFAACRDHAEQGRNIYDAVAHRGHKFVYAGHDPGVCARITGALSLWLLGYPDRAVERADEGLALAEELAHPFSLLHALAYTSFLHQFRREPGVVLERAERAIAVSREQNVAPQLFATGKVMRGWALAALGQPEGIEGIGEGLDDLRVLGVEHRRPYYLALLAEAHGLGGSPGEALDTIARALEVVERRGERWWEAEIHRLKGAVLAAHQPERRPEAAASLCRAVEVAGGQGAGMLELRAAGTLARLWADGGDRPRARGLLGPVYGQFREGFDTSDLLEAKELLDAL